MTVLLVFPDCIFRVSEGADATPVAVERLAGLPLANALAQALESEKARTRVAVLSEEVFAQSVRLPARQVSGLTNEELRAAIAYELAPFTGLNETNSVLQFVRGAGSPGEVVFEAQQCEAELLQTFAEGVQAAHCEFAGAGALGPKAQSRAPEALLREAARVSGARAAPLLTLQSPSREAWVRPVLAGAAAFLAVLALGLALRAHVRAGTQGLLADLGAVHAQEQANYTLQRQIVAARQTLEQAPAQGAQGPANEKRQELRPAWATLLSTLGEAFQGRAVLQQWDEVAPWDVRISALAADAPAQEASLQALAEGVAAAGWRVVLEVAAPTRCGDTSAPWSFSFRISRADPDYAGNVQTMYMVEGID